MAQLIVALDVPDKDRALALARELRGIVAWCKVGLELFTLAGPSVLEALNTLGYKVFLDLKMYDIPNTVGRAVLAAALAGVDMLTLHCQGGERMCAAARESLSAAPGAPPLLFGVTALTSFMSGEMPGMDAQPADFALALALKAQEWRLDGIVCSGREAAKIKAACPRLRCLCPGIRLSGSAAGDQRRVVTPAEAVAEGADFLVVGRPIVASSSPVNAAWQILAEMTI